MCASTLDVRDAGEQRLPCAMQGALPCASAVALALAVSASGSVEACASAAFAPAEDAEMELGCELGGGGGRGLLDGVPMWRATGHAASEDWSASTMRRFEGLGFRV